MILRIKSFFDGLPFGLAPFLIIVTTLIAGVWLYFHPIPENTANIRYWTFTHISYEGNQESIREFEEQHPGVQVDLQLVYLTAVTSQA